MSPEQIRAMDDATRAPMCGARLRVPRLVRSTGVRRAFADAAGGEDPRRPPAPLRSIKPDLPPDLEWVVGHCLGKDPAKRFQNVGELAAALCPFASPRSRIVAERCRYVLDPTAAFEDLDETTGPVSWNGLSTGLESSGLRPAPSTPSQSGMERVTVVARRIVRERRRYTPLAGVAALGLLLGFWRALSASPEQPTMASQTFLAAPGGADPSTAEVFRLEEPTEGVPSGTAPTAGAETITLVPETAATAVAEPAAARPVPRVAPRRPAPPARPKAPASSSTANEPDVGF